MARRGPIGSWSIHLPLPGIPPLVDKLFKLASQEWWCDFGYDPEKSGEMVRSDDIIATATLDHIKTMLTFCVRGERFCDGHWFAMIVEGRITAILRRLKQLRDAI